MTDDGSPIDDELVSAVLDGDTTVEERALVEGSLEGRRRLAELRAAAALVATPPLALDVSRVDALVGRALDAADTPPRQGGVDTLSHRRAAKGARAESWRRGLTMVAAAVVAIVVVGGLVLAVGRGGSESANDSASDSASKAPTAGSAGGSTSDMAEEAESRAANDGSDSIPIDLGPLPDAAAVLAGYATLVSEGPLSSFASPAPTAEQSLPQDASEVTCAVPPIAIRPGETWALVAVARLPTGPVVVMADTAAGALGRAVVVDSSTCTVVAEGTP